MATPRNAWLRPSRRARDSIATVTGMSAGDVRRVLTRLGRGATAAGIDAHTLAGLVDLAEAGDKAAGDTLLTLVKGGA